MHTGYAVYVFVYQSLLTLHAVPEPMRTILLIEYEYVRMYIHSLPLQAFVERAVATWPAVFASLTSVLVALAAAFLAGALAAAGDAPPRPVRPRPSASRSAR